MICSLDDLENPDPTHRAYRVGLLREARQYLEELNPDSLPPRYLSLQSHQELTENDYWEFE